MAVTADFINRYVDVAQSDDLNGGSSAGDAIYTLTGNATAADLAKSHTFVAADVSVAANTITEAAHGLLTGGIVVLSTTGTLPAPLAITTNYYVIVVDANTYKLASTSANCAANTAIDITDTGSGGATHTTSWTESTITDDASGSWGSTAVNMLLCYDTAGATPLIALVLELSYGANANVIRTTYVAAAASKNCRVGGAWKSIRRATLKTINSLSQWPSNLEFMVWIKAGTYTPATGEAGSTGIVDCFENALLRPKHFQGYTSAEGDGTDTCVLIDANGSGKHGVDMSYPAAQYHRFRFLGARANTNNKNAWGGAASTYYVRMEDLSATASGNANSNGFNLPFTSVLTRGRVISASGVGVLVSLSNTIEACDIRACAIGINGTNPGVVSISDTIIANTTGHGIGVTGLLGCPVTGCTFYNIGTTAGDAINMTVAPVNQTLVARNCIFETVSGEALDLPVGSFGFTVDHCAFYNCGGGAGTTYFSTTTPNQNTMTLENANVFQTSGSFFASTTTFSLNNTTGRGRLARTTGTGGRDIGAVQSAYPIVGNVFSGIDTGNNVGTLIVGGMASNGAVLLKTTGAAARGGSGTCAKLTPPASPIWGYWDFYVPVNTNMLTFSMWHKISASWNGSLKISIYDTDQTSLLITSETVTLTDDGDYHEYSASSMYPAAVGLCRIRIEIQDGGTTGYVYIDDITATQ